MGRRWVSVGVIAATMCFGASASRAATASPRRLAPNPVPVWTAESDHDPQAMSVDAAGNTLFFGSSAYRNGSDTTGIDRFDPSGNVLPSTFFGFDGGGVAAFDAAGNAYVAGEFRDPHTGLLSILVEKVAPDGTQLWHRDYPQNTIAQTYFRGIAVAPDGSFVVTARFVAYGFPTSLVDRFTPDGTMVWSRHPQSVAGVAIDGQGRIYVGVAPARVVAYDAGGVRLWSHSLHKAFPITFLGISANRSGVLLSTTEDRHPGPVRPVVIALDAGGNERWRSVLPAGTNPVVAASPTGEIAVAWALPYARHRVRVQVGRLAPATGALTFSAPVAAMYDGDPLAIATTADRIVVGGYYAIEFGANLIGVVASFAA